MQSLSEQILLCVTLAGDGRYTEAQIANILSQTEEWVEQVLAAWEYNPKAYVQRPTFAYDPGPSTKPVDLASQRTNMTYDSGNRPVTFVYDTGWKAKTIDSVGQRTNMIYDSGNHRPIRLPDSESKSS